MKKHLYALLFLWAACSHYAAIAQTTETVIGYSNWGYGAGTADLGIAGNVNGRIMTTASANAPFSSDADGSGTRAIAYGCANGANTKAWVFNLATTKYRTLRFSCRLLGTNSPTG